MSTWSVSLSADDIYADIYYEFFELYNEGYPVNDISAKLITENKDIHDDPTDPNAGHNFWFALAKAQWECKQLDSAVLARVRHIITDGSNIAAWRDLGAREADIKKRQVILEKFLHQLDTERPTPRQPRKKSSVIRQPAYHKGDCLTFKFHNGHYGGVIVLEAIAGTRDTGSYNLIAATDLDLPRKPTVQDFKKANIIYIKHEDFDPETSKSIWVEEPFLTWCMGTYPKDVCELVEVAGTMPVKKSYEAQYRNTDYFWTGPFNGNDIERIETLLRTGKQPKTTKVKKYTGHGIFS